MKTEKYPVLLNSYYLKKFFWGGLDFHIHIHSFNVGPRWLDTLVPQRTDDLNAFCDV